MGCNYTWTLYHMTMLTDNLWAWPWDTCFLVSLFPCLHFLISVTRTSYKLTMHLNYGTHTDVFLPQRNRLAHNQRIRSKCQSIRCAWSSLDQRGKATPWQMKTFNNRSLQEDKLKCTSRRWAVKNTSSIVVLLVNNRRVQGYSQPNLCWSIYLTSVNNMLKLKHSSWIWPFSYFWKTPKGHFIVVKYISWGAVQCLIDSQGISSPTQNTGVMDESLKADVNLSQIRYIHRLFIFCILSTNL